jgi:hypothetical protein
LLEIQASLNRVSASHEASGDVRTAAASAAETLLDSIRELEEASDKGIEYSATQLITSLRKLSNLLDNEATGASKGIYNV